MTHVGISDLQRIRAWAHEKISTGAEPPWSWYQHMKLREALDVIIAGMPAVAAVPEAGAGWDTGLRLVRPLDPTPKIAEQVEVQLPM